MLTNPSPLLLATLQTLFNRCLTVNTFLKQWSDISVVPIYKAGVRGDPSNYGPIELIPATAKLYMSILQSIVSMGSN